uniref:Uncharacterized protein n=1 Tax=Trichuris muris TaxID=70415 RepID=A0A5S6Q7W2_TRIMR
MSYWTSREAAQLGLLDVIASSHQSRRCKQGGKVKMELEQSHCRKDECLTGPPVKQRSWTLVPAVIRTEVASGGNEFVGAVPLLKEFGRPCANAY